jgi:hypothetical protein
LFVTLFAYGIIFFFLLLNLNSNYQVMILAECFPTVSYVNLEEGDSTTPLESCAEATKMFEDEDNDPANPGALTIDHRSFADELSDTSELNHDNDADHAFLC